MSYDFELSRTPNDEGSTSAPGKKEREASGTSASGGLGGLSKDEIKRRLADLLIAMHPGFQESEKDYQKIAKSKPITETEVRRRYGYIELTDDDGLPGAPGFQP